jgi:hypothetical protein
MNSDEQPGPVTERAEPTSSGEGSAQSSRLSTQPSHHPQRSVELHIKKLVLDGFEPASRYLIGEAVERELTRLFTDQGVPVALGQGGEMSRLGGGAFELEPGSKAETIGIQLAQTIYRGFDQ